LPAIANKRASGSIPLLMALAGSDTEDHEPTMRLAEALFREKIPKVSTALVHPAELRSLSYANRKIMEKLRNTHSSETDSRVDENQEEDNEQDDDEELEEFPFNFSDMQKTKEDSVLTVLLFQGVDAAPKDVLRHVLCFWHAQCLENGAPLLIFLGLKELPPNRQSLFDLEDDEQLPFLHVDTVQLFDSTKVCEQLLNCLIEDCSCPLTMCPDNLKRLREIYTTKRQSVSHILRTLFLVFDDAMAEGAISGLSQPLRFMCNDGNDAPPEIVQNHFQSEFRRRAEVLGSADVVKQFHHLWPQEAASSLPIHIANAAAEAMAWRCRLVASLPLYEVLMIGAWDTVKFYARLQRIHGLLEAIWPVPAEKEAQQEQALEEKFNTMQHLLNGLTIKKFQRLLHNIREVVSSCVSKTLAQDLHVLIKQTDEFGDSEQAERGTDISTLDQLRHSFRKWVNEVKRLYWQPLGGKARDVFLASGSLNCSKGSLDNVEQHLTSKFEGKLQYLASTSFEKFNQDVEEPLADATRLFQILECSSGRFFKIAELWRSFTQLVSDFNAAEVMKAPKTKSASGDKEKDLQALKRRFQMALLALYQLGLFAPASGGAQKGVSGWRLKKRIFGRVWLRERAPKERLEPDTPPKVAKEVTNVAKPQPVKRIREKQPQVPVAVPVPVAPEPAASPSKFLKSLCRRDAYKPDAYKPNGNDVYTPQKKRKKEVIFFG